MFGWRKRNEGFEWREYVRTTILVRREKRRQHIEELREAAVNKVKEAGERGVRAGAAGADKVGRAAKAGLVGAGRSLHDNVQGWGGWAGERMAQGAAAATAMAGALGGVVKRWSQAAFQWVRQREEGSRTAVLVIAGAAAFWAVARYWGHGLDGEAKLAAGVAAVALGLAGLISMIAAPRGSGLADIRDRLGDAMGAIPLPGGRAVGAGVALAAAAAVGWMWLQPGARPGFGSLPGHSRSLTGRSGTGGGDSRGTGQDETVVTGRAVAVAGDMIRVAGRRIKLEAIEAPELDQKCAAEGSRTWACGTAAVQALAARVASRPVRCEVSAADDGAHGVCRIDGSDIASGLVRGGHVFAQSGWFARYATEEAEARTAKAGIWRGGAAERPTDYRSKRWQEASRTAPDGCPIKGQKSSPDRRVYVLPWSPQYDRVKVRTARGERWFCSEAEAQAAGWKPVEKS